MEFVWNKPQLTGILTEVFEKYVREVEAKSENEADYPIRQAVCYIEEHYTGDCSLAAISDYVHMNPNYFSTFFKQKTGQNLNSYVAQYRMNMAKQMLRGSDDTIQEIAYRLTYSDVKHFRHLFKKYVGIAPMKFRELYR